MGLFSSKKKHTVDTQIQRVVEDNMMPETVKTSVMRALFAKGEEVSIPEYLINGFADSVALKADRLMRYAEDSYSYGLPRSDVGSRNDAEGIVQQVLEGQLGHSIIIENYALAPLNSLHYGWVSLVEDHGYNPTTNEITGLSALEGFPVYLKDMLAVYTAASFDERDLASLDQWGLAARAGYTPERPVGLTIGKYSVRSHAVRDEDATEDTVEILYVFTNADGTLVEKTLALPVSGFDDEAEYHHVRYRWNLPDGSSQVGFWLYENGSGLYPTIDDVQAFPFEEIGTFFPFIHFRRDKNNMSDPSHVGTPDYETSVKMVDYFGMDFDKICEQIHENPDIDAVEQAMMIMGVDVDDPDPVCQRYLFDHFNALWATGNGLVDYPDQITKAHEFVQVIADREFEMTFSYAGIRKRRKAGKFAEISEHETETSEFITSDEYMNRASGVVTEELHQETGSVFTVRRQINDNLYDEISIYKPELRYHIYRDKAHRAGYGADALMIPLDYAVFSTYSLPEREVLLARSMHFVFNTRVTTKTKWYETGVFKVFAIVLAVVVMVYFQVDLLGPLLAAIEAGVIAVVQLVVTQIVIGLVIQKGFQLIVAEIGGDFALVLAAIATAVALYYGVVVKSVKGAPWAQDLLMAASGMTRAVQAETRALLEDLQEEMLEFQDYAEEQLKLLDAAEKELETSSLINPIEFVGMAPFSVAGEEPQDYYNRTVHSGNVGIRSLHAISEYVEAALTLPKMNETLRSDFNV